MSRLPPFMALRALEAAARLRSYSRAAEELHVTHGAISHQIRRLEEEYGLKLFRREGNAMAPTDPALRLAAKVAQATRLMQQGSDELAALRGATTLVISTLQSFAIRWLAPRLAGFADRHPDFEIEVRADDRLADFASDGVDVAVRYGAGGWPGVEVEEIFSERLFPVCSPEFLERHPLASMQDLAGVPLLRHRRRAWALWFRSAGIDIDEPTTGVIFDDSNMLIAAAAAGLGVALAPATLAEAELAAGRLVRPFPVSTEAEYGYFLVWRPDSLKLAAIGDFRDWIREQTAGARAERAER
jgi:LysR family glycine cleavage system transcriptional activator